MGSQDPPSPYTHTVLSEKGEEELEREREKKEEKKKKKVRENEEKKEEEEKVTSRAETCDPMP